MLNEHVRNADVEVVVDAAWALSYVADGTTDAIQPVIGTGCIPRMVSLLNHPNAKVQVPAIRLVGNVVTGNEAQTQIILDYNAIPLLVRLAQSSRKAIRKEACWCISNIVCGTKAQAECIVNSHVFPIMLKVFKDQGIVEIRKEIMWAVINLFIHNDLTFLSHIADIGFIDAIVGLISLQTDDDILGQVLEFIERILQAGDVYGTVRFYTIISTADGFSKLEDVATNTTQHEHAVKATMIRQAYSTLLHRTSN